MGLHPRGLMAEIKTFLKRSIAAQDDWNGSFFIFCEFSFKTSQNKESQRRADIRGLTTVCIFSLQLDEPITRRVGRGRGCKRGAYIWRRSFMQHTQNNFDTKARFIRCISAVSNAIQTKDNEANHLIIYCLNYIRHSRNGTYEPA